MIHTYTYTRISPPLREICRYAGCPEPGEAETAQIHACLAEAEGKLACRVCFTELPLPWDKLPAGSRSLQVYLTGCSRILLFGATIGLETDRLIARYGRISPVKSLFFQAIGAAAIEELCDTFCRDMEQAYAPARLKPRFSPGYGDVPLTLQRDIFALLDCPRKIGLTLNESMLMSPGKSVTALVGIQDPSETI